ncbi:L,D-transpeptidase family protein [uncultured Roseovarius sp.]|uniref:L,D-transpeptidase family protein n=1 Tax=uncultured Roseovarius sp. TaxID=293344 RepID=UPI00261D8BDC|nr:L,D-transpeptidase family protein [uncultured Roseovarius sp.]
MAVVFAALIGSSGAEAQVTGFKQAVAEAAAKDRDLAAFYQSNGYQGIWTGNSGKDRRRRQELFKAIEAADMHGLPVARYDANGLKTQMKAARSARERGLVEVALSKTFVQLARDMQTGALVPSRIDDGIKRKVPYRNRTSYLTAFSKSSPRNFFRALPPQTNEYARLMKEKIRLEKLLGQGGWGQKVPAKSLKPGASGNAVVVLRNRLISMGYMRRSSSQSYDANMQKAIQQFQLDHGLNPDGVAGAGTMTEINRPVQARLQSVIVAMERERWLNRSRGERHVLVNLTDFSARIIDGDKVTFQTRAVVGKNVSDRRSPEFSDVMEFLVINPTWNVPRSIAVKEYLPMMKRNPNAAGHLQLYDGRGRKVSRSAVNFAAFNARNFPFDIKQPPSRRNALGLVKFMFPNKYNIYLHDTPQKKLFAREKRDFSHGCIRLHQPFEFAYEMLSKQERDPKNFFHAKLDTGRETVVQLEKPVPVHITYRTAFTQAKGRTQFRGDVYGRDAKIWSALSKAGVSLRGVQG